MADNEHCCSKCGHTDRWKDKKKSVDRGKLNDLFYDVLYNEVNQGDEKKFKAWIAKFATKSPKDFMKEWTKLQPKDLKVEQSTTLNYIMVGKGKQPVPGKLPVITEGEGLDNLKATPADKLN